MTISRHLMKTYSRTTPKHIVRRVYWLVFIMIFEINYLTPNLGGCDEQGRFGGIFDYENKRLQFARSGEVRGCSLMAAT